MGCLNSKSRLKENRQFKEVYNKGNYSHSKSFVLYYLKSEDSFFGFTATKKIGNAVKRNRAKRRLKALIQEQCNNLKKGIYVIVAKEAIHSTSFASLQLDLVKSLKKQKLLLTDIAVTKR